MFKRLPDDKRPTIALSIDGRTIEAREGDTVAAALLAAGVMVARSTPVSETSRAPYCMMGVCFDCLMEIDGVGSRQACLVSARAGMVVRTQHGARKL